MLRSLRIAQQTSDSQCHPNQGSGINCQETGDFGSLEAGILNFPKVTQVVLTHQTGQPLLHCQGVHFWLSFPQTDSWILGQDGRGIVTALDGTEVGPPVRTNLRNPNKSKVSYFELLLVHCVFVFTRDWPGAPNGRERKQSCWPNPGPKIEFENYN